MQILSPLARHLHLVSVAAESRDSTLERVADDSWRNCTMLYSALLFFIVAIVAAVLGYGGAAGAFAYIATILFWVFVVLCVVSLFAGLLSKERIYGPPV